MNGVNIVCQVMCVGALPIIIDGTMEQSKTKAKASLTPMIGFSLSGTI